MKRIGLLLLAWVWLFFGMSFPALAGGVFQVTEISHPQQADLLILTTSLFADSQALRQLAFWRATHDDFDVAILNVENLSSEVDPETIRQALVQIYYTWSAAHTPSRQLGYLLIVGDHEHIPALLLPIPYEGSKVEAFYTDYPYATMGWEKPQIALGRIPVRNERELADIVDKILRYESQPPSGVQGVLYIMQFYPRIAQELLEAWSPSSEMNGQLLVEPPAGGDEAVAEVLEALSQDWRMVFYLGHATVTGWRLLPNTEVKALEERDSPLLIFAEACDSAQFTNPGHESFAERLLKMPTGGAVAYIGATTQIPANQDLLEAVTQTVFQENARRIGDILFSVQQKLAPKFALPIVLLGDPAMSLPEQASSRPSVFGEEQNTRMRRNPAAIPVSRFGLYPNPSYGGSVHIEYISPGDADVILRIFDLAGREVERQHFQVSEGQRLNVLWEPQSLTSGLYFVQFEIRFSNGSERRILRKVSLIH